MQIGAKVIRKAHLQLPNTAFGILEGIKGAKARVLWTYNGRRQHSTLALSSIVEVSPEMERDIRVRATARYEAMKLRVVSKKD